MKQYRREGSVSSETGLSRSEQSEEEFSHQSALKERGEIRSPLRQETLQKPG